MYQGCCMIPSTVMRFFTSASKIQSSKSRHSFDNCIQPDTDGWGQQQEKNESPAHHRKWGRVTRM